MSGAPPPFDASRSSAGKRSPWLLALIVSIATFMEVLDITIANVSLRHIAGSLAAGLDESTWILTSYLVANAVILPVSGWLATAIGRRRFYMICVVLFTASSVLCGFATSLEMLIFFRVLQGLGGGGMVPTGQAMLTDSFPPHLRGFAFALFGIAVVIAPTIGPTLGGYITDHFSWHWVFFINGPVGLLSLALVNAYVVEPDALERERKQILASGFKIDWLGFFLVALCLGSLEVVLDKGQQENWFESNFILVFATLSAVGFACLIPWELAQRRPVFDVRLFGNPQFAIPCLTMLVTGALLIGSTQQLPQLMQQHFGYTATLAGFALLPAGIATATMMPVAGKLVASVQPKYLMVIGTIAMAYGMLYTTTLTPDVDFGFFVLARVLQVVGLGFLFVPIQAAAYASLPPEKTNNASAMINGARNIGGSIGISFATTLLAQRSQAHQAHLADHLVPSDLAYQQAVHGATSGLVAAGTPPGLAESQALGLIAHRVAEQASLLSYIDVFRAFTLIGFAMALVALVALRPVKDGPRPAAGGGH